ncbi:FtsX-like permease family protein [Chitinophaga jiangningensis]|uniref:FtsX-like permease family protein n=1 Tax=Chitinophaga jiangningensis TaxID=1419482 RepID=A0A1M7AT14_9BACT|nr:ABC transporter permease [Chitinophaga jiangningensis]SHL45797.1 FtsX-like permease family protein [Chitinophaga jiangningensis]
MLKTWMQTAFRYLSKNPRFTWLNVAGLSVAMAAVLLISRWVIAEYETDRFHAKQGRLYQVMENRTQEGSIATAAETSPLLGETLPAQFPEVEMAVTTTPENWFPKVAVTAADKPVRAAAIFAGKDYFRIFSYPMLTGQPSQVLADKQSIVISRKLATSLFGSPTAAIGKTISWQLMNLQRTSIVSGISDEIPAASSIHFDMVLPFAVFRDIMQIPQTLDGSNAAGPFHTYLALRPGTNPAAFNKKLSTWISSFNNQPRDLFLTSYADNYLYSLYENGRPSGGRITYIKLFAWIAILILVIAGINFMNLTTAGASRRMKEIGVRKAMGAARASLVRQFLLESIGIATLSALTGLLLAVLLLPYFNQVTGKEMHLLQGTYIWLLLPALPLVTGLLAGCYPACYLSGLKPVTVLKGKLPVNLQELFARKGLLTFQFTISLILLCAVLVLYRQLHYLQKTSPGFDKDQVITFEAEGRIATNIPAYLEAVKQVPGITQSAAMVGNMTSMHSAEVKISAEGREHRLLLSNVNATKGLVETLGIPMLAGTSFTGNAAADSGKVMLNKAAVVALQLQDPVGKLIKIGDQQRRIIGITENFHSQSLHEPIQPTVFQVDDLVQTVLLRLNAGQETLTLAALKTFTEKYNPGFAFEYRFLDDTYQAQYATEQQVARISACFAVVALSLCCLGIFGLTAYSAQLRRKEIGIRKVLGASMMDIVWLFSGDFKISLLLSLSIAIPIAWWGMNKWLAGYAYHIPAAGILIAIPAIILVLLVAGAMLLQTIHAWKSAAVQHLRAE